MDAQDNEGRHADSEVGPPLDESGELAEEAGESPASGEAASERGDPSADADPADDGQFRVQLAGVDTQKLQRAIENLANRIAEARSRGAVRASVDSRHDAGAPFYGSRTASPADSDGLGHHTGDHDVSERQLPKAPYSERQLTALELRMRQIAEIAGAPLAEDISADIAALRGKMDRLSRADGVLSTRMEAIQRQLAHLHETLDMSSAPVVDRLAELETRLDEIGEALASRHLSIEARASVEHSCSYILGAIARIEGLVQQAAPPEGMWDRIAAVPDRLARLPTLDNIAGLEQRIDAVSERLGAVSERGDRSEALAGLEQRLSEIAATTRAAVEEIRERPAYDPSDVRTLLERIERWRSEKPPSELPGVGSKLDAIADKVEQLSRSDNVAALSTIQEQLSDLAGTVSAQSANLSGLDLVGLQERLGRIYEELATSRHGRPEGATLSTKESLDAAFGRAHEDDDDHELAKQLAIRFAPQSASAQGAGHGESTGASGDDDVSGAFDAVQEALEALVGQIPFLERTWESAGATTTPSQQSPTSENEPKAASVGPGDPMPVATDRHEPGPEASGGADALPNRPTSIDQPHWRADREVTPLHTPRPSNPGDPADAARVLASIDKNAALDAGAADAKLSPEAEAVDSRKDPTSYADAAHRIGRYSTWRKAKVAVVAANTPKY
jgi:hypothetical protein